MRLYFHTARECDDTNTGVPESERDGGWKTGKGPETATANTEVTGCSGKHMQTSSKGCP